MKLSPQEAERVRARIQAWQGFANEMHALRAQELRCLTEADAGRICDQLSLPPAEIYRSPAALNGSGLVEQQRIFSKAHARPA